MNSRNLDELEKKFIDGIKYGLELQEKGIKIVNACEIGKEYIDSLRKKKDYLEKPEVQAWLAGANATIPYHTPEIPKQIIGYTMAVSTSSSSASVVYHNLFPEINVSKFSEASHINYNSDMVELDGYLKNFDKESNLVTMRKGAWDSFHSAAGNKLQIAAHSMREILSNIVSKWASNENVMKAKWWIKPKGMNKPDLRQRLRYLIFGSAQKDDAALEMVNETVKICFNAYDKLQKVAHGSKKLKEEVREAMRITEYTLLTIFRARELKYSKEQ